MPDERRFDDDPAYWLWHRPRSLTRFLSTNEAASLWLFDRDPGSEACRYCAKTLMLVEAVRGVTSPKSARVTKQLGRDLDRRAVLVRYELSKNGARIPGSNLADVTTLEVTRLWPEPEETRAFTPEAWAQFLVQVRRDHYRECTATG